MMIAKQFAGIDGGRVMLTLSIENAPEMLITTEHKQVTDSLTVSISGEYAPKGVRFGTRAGSWGQVQDMVHNARLRGLWNQWHLNDMRAGCAHMPRRSDGSPACEIGSGYRYGQAWLIEPLTDEGLDDLLTIFGGTREQLADSGV